MDQQSIIAQQNKSIRGYIMRALAGSPSNTVQGNVITAMLISDKQVTSPDITKHLNYLLDKNYIAFVGKETNAIDGVIRLTAQGTDLIEGTINDTGVLL